MKERLTAWSLRVAEYEHQFKAIDEAQNTFGVREMMPKDINRELLTGPRKVDEIMEQLEIIINETTTDDGPVPMFLGNVGTHDARRTWSDSDTSNDMSHDVCAIAWKGHKAGKGTGKKGSNGPGVGHRGKGADEWTSGRGDDGSKKGGEKSSRCIKLVWYSDKDEGGTEKQTQGQARARARPDVATVAESKGTSE